MPYVPYAWQERGDTMSLESIQSKRLNVSGFMNKRNELEAYTFEGTVDGDVVVRCMDEFCTTLQGPTIVVMDNASIHTSATFQE